MHFIDARTLDCTGPLGARSVGEGGGLSARKSGAPDAIRGRAAEGSIGRKLASPSPNPGPPGPKLGGNPCGLGWGTGGAERGGC